MRELAAAGNFPTLHGKMSAKKSSQQPKNSPTPSTAPAPTAAAAAGAAAPAATAEEMTPWIESTNPRKRMWGKIALVVLWVYVAALWLLALDQWFNWGIFGPKIPPVP